MEIRKLGHSAYRTEYHVVWISKYRRRILRPGLVVFLYRVLLNLIKSMPGVEIIEHNIQVDHLHLVMIIPPVYSISEVVGRLKGRSSSIMRKKFKWIRQVYEGKQNMWSPGYFVSTVGIDERTILNYVKYQQDQDTGQVKLDL